MLRVGVLLCLIGFAAAVPKPTTSRSQKEIQDFREFLEKTKFEDGYRLSERMLANPKGNVWENSGRFEGDIILDQWQIDELIDDFSGNRKAYIRPNTRWPGNTVVFEFGAFEFTQEQVSAIWATIRDIERNTCIRFRLRNNNDVNFVRLTGRTTGCYANVGFWNGRGVHTMNLARNRPGVGCFNHVVIIHEWLHIIGFFHMQSTYNRYNYVRVLWENIAPGMAHNFYRHDQNIVSNHGLIYEYISCMHYGTHGFSVNGRPTLQATRQFNGVMGQTQFVTRVDWFRANRHYNCPGAWSEDIEDMEQMRELVHAEDVKDVRIADEQPEFVPEQQELVPEQELLPEQQELVPEQQ